MIYSYQNKDELVDFITSEMPKGEENLEPKHEIYVTAIKCNSLINPDRPS
jgi:hypothetical protein